MNIKSPPKQVRKMKLGLLSRPLRILVADDTLTMQQLIQTIFESLNHLITVVTNGKEVVEQVENQDFDLILMDVRMPVMDGLEATKIIRAMNGDKSAVPIIALTADITAGNIKSYSNIGINEVCSKPIELPVLLKAINKIFNEEIHSNSSGVDIQESSISQMKVVVDEVDEDFSQLLQRVSSMIESTSNVDRFAHSKLLNIPGVSEEKVSSMMSQYEETLYKSCKELCSEFNEFTKKPKDEKRRKNISIKTHTIKGSGSSYGYHLVTIIATVADDIFNKKTLDEKDLLNVAHHIDALYLIAEKKLIGDGGEAGNILLHGLKRFS